MTFNGESKPIKVTCLRGRLLSKEEVALAKASNAATMASGMSRSK